MKFSMVLAGILILAVADLSLGQAERMKPGDVKAVPQAEKIPATQAMMKFRPDLKVVTLNDGLQCLLSKADQLNAAYAEAAASGCKKVSTTQGTVYNCGFQPSTYLPKCQAAAQKVKSILDGCGLKAPEHISDPTSDPVNPVTPGCNSLGISCVISAS